MNIDNFFEDSNTRVNLVLLDSLHSFFGKHNEIKVNISKTNCFDNDTVDTFFFPGFFH